MKKICKFCKKEINVKTFQAFGGHVATCSSNPNYDKMCERNRKNATKGHIEITSCKKCSKEFKQYITPKGFIKQYCSRSCANSRIITELGKRKRSITLKQKYNNIQSIEKRFKDNMCVICGKIFKTKNFIKRQTCGNKICYKKILSNKAKERKLGGHLIGEKIKFKNIKDEEYHLQSSYELRFAESMNNQNIYWIRPKPLKWLDKNKNWHWYYPDFYIPKTNIYYDTKNDYLIKEDKDKIERVRKQNNIQLIILDKNNLIYMPT